MEPTKASAGLRWWTVLTALAYLLNLALLFYLILWGPAELLGFVASFSDEAMVVRSVDPDSPVALAGLRAGDRVLTIHGQPIRNVREYNSAAGNSWAGRVEHWVLERGGDRITLEIAPTTERLTTRLTTGYLQLLCTILTGSFLGFLIAWKRPADRVALIGAWFIITAAIAFGLPPGWAVVWRELPRVLQLLLWLPQLSRFVLEGILLSFFVLFPRPMITRRWWWFAIWGPVLITLPWRISAFYAVIYPGAVAPAPNWILQAAGARTILYLFFGIAVLAVSYRRFLDANEKRRVRILMLGTAVSLAAATFTVWLDAFFGRMNGVWNVFVYGVVPFYAACPLSLSYAVLRHRVLDISVIIRQGLQYALARGGVIGFVPLVGALFVLDLTINSDQRIADIFGTRGWIYAVAAALALITYWNRRAWIEAIDRRFFREQYNAQHLLREVAGEVRSAGDFERAAARVVERIETALHPEFVSVLVHPPAEPEYRAVATSPQGQLPPRLSAENKVVALLHVLGKPLELLLGNSGWLDERLPQEESEFVRRARIDLLVPIASGPTQTEALLACGIKRSEEPYTREDQQLLEAIAASLALLLETPATVERPAGTFTECPECGTCYDATVVSCRHDNERLVPMRVPRMLAGRYRLERRRGKGGMGAVYEATDRSLERRVAIKLIRDDLVDSVDARNRFRREARAAASFTHPNVVTIYDYGVDGDTRAFLVMELLHGGTLRDELRQRKRLPAARIVEILRGVCSAVEAAHHRELIHRDLKPENIFIVDGPGGLVKVLDFGIAKFLPSHDDSAPTRMTAATDTGVLIGTPAYMSPEQLMGQPLNVQWDLWALSVVAYEALTGALPFAGGSIGDWSRGILSGSFTPLSQHLEQPPEQWQEFFTQVFSGHRLQRPQSAAEFFRRLEQLFAL